MEVKDLNFYLIRGVHGACAKRARSVRKAFMERAQGVYGACMKRAGSMLGACKEWSCPPAGSGGGLRKIVTEKWRREGKDVEYSMY